MQSVTVTAGAVLVCLALTGAPAQAAETRDYVVSLFIPAMNSVEGDCPQGLTPDPGEMLKRELIRQKVPGAEMEKILGSGGERKEFVQYMSTRGLIDGKAVSSYLYPWAVPPIEMNTVVSNAALGFDLDGQEGKEDFVDPQTKSRGVDNELSRVLGCIASLRGTPDHPATLTFRLWDAIREGNPAWIVRVSDIDSLENDDRVDVKILKAFEPVTKDVLAEVQRDMTYTIDQNPRVANNEFHGKIKDGMFVSEETNNIYMMGESNARPDYDFYKARIRFTFQQDGSISGFLGGFTRWEMVYLSHSAAGSSAETQDGIELPAFYRSLRDHADGEMNPNSGLRTISSTYQIKAVPAFIWNERSGVASLP